MSSRRNYPIVAALWLVSFLLGAWAAEDGPSVDQVIARIASYKFGDSRESLSTIEAFVRRAGQAPGEADRLAALLHPLLAKEATLECKEFVCRQLAVLGSKVSVAPLAPLLADEQLSDMARYALERINDPAAGRALLAALNASPKKTTLGIINSLGNRQESAAIAALVERSQAADADVRAAAIHALGKIGGEASARALLRLKESATSELRTQLLDASLACADKFARQGQTVAAKALYQSALAESEPVMIRVAAFKGLVAVDKVSALPIMLKHLSDSEPELQDAALSLVRDFPGAEATQAFAIQVKKLSPSRAALLLRALADREDRSVLSIVMSALESSDEGVRKAALYALGRLGDADAVTRLAQVASTATGEEQAAARESLVVLRGNGVDAAMMALLENPSVKSRAEVAAALGRRNSVAAVRTLLRTAQDADPAIRLASINSLGSLAAQDDLPALVELLLQAPSGDVHAAAAKSVVETARRMAEPEGRLTVVLRALSESKVAAARVRLLPVVGQIGGTRAVAAMESALKDESAEARDAAVRTLAAWSTPEALSTLLNIVKTSQLPEQRLLALQGYIRLLGVAGDRSPQQRLAGYEEAFQLATRLDEKRQILAGLPRVRVPETLRFVLPLLADPDLSEDAARAAVLLSTIGRRSEISRVEARAAMRQVLAVAKTPAIREAATSILESPEKR